MYCVLCSMLLRHKAGEQLKNVFFFQTLSFATHLHELKICLGERRLCAFVLRACACHYVVASLCQPSNWIVPYRRRRRRPRHHRRHHFGECTNTHMMRYTHVRARALSWKKWFFGNRDMICCKANTRIIWIWYALSRSTQTIFNYLKPRLCIPKFCLKRTKRANAYECHHQSQHHTDASIAFGPKRREWIIYSLNGDIAPARRPNE